MYLYFGLQRSFSKLNSLLTAEEFKPIIEVVEKITLRSPEVIVVGECPSHATLLLAAGWCSIFFSVGSPCRIARGYFH